MAALSAVPDEDLVRLYLNDVGRYPLLTKADEFVLAYQATFDLATGISGHDVVLQVLPQFHVGGWNVQSVLAWWKGARVLLERGFDAGRALELIERRALIRVIHR